MYYEVYVETEGKSKDDFINHLYDCGYNFYEAKHNSHIILVLQDEMEYVQTIADDHYIEINLCNI